MENANRKSSPAKLQNALVESVVVVGVDPTTGLQPARQMGVVAEEPLPLFNLYSTTYDASVLAAITYDTARFHTMGPDGFLMMHPNYPTHYSRVSNDVHKPSYSEPSSPSDTPQVVRRPTRHSSPAATSRKYSRRISVKPQDDVLNATVPLCFPDGVNVHRTQPTARTHSIVMTNMCGERTYGSCLTYFRPYHAQEASRSADCSFVLRSTDTEGCFTIDEEEESLTVYAPVCLLLVSKHPYFSVLKDAASCLVAKLLNNPSESDDLLKKAALQLTAVPVPPPGKVDLTFLFYDLGLVLQAPETPGASLCDLDMSLLFMTLSLDNVLRVIAAILTQKSIVFLSSNYALLTIIIEELCSIFNHTQKALQGKANTGSI